MVLLGPGVIEETKANSTKADNRLVDMNMARHPSGGDVPATVVGYGALRPVQLGVDRGIHLHSLSAYRDASGTGVGTCHAGFLPS